MSIRRSGRYRGGMSGGGMSAMSMCAMLMSAAATFAPCALANPAVNMANVPIFDGSGNVHPNVVLSLSVEFPTVGVAYRGDGGTYNRTYEYIGYFNPLKCYSYNGGNRNLTDSGYFYSIKNADALHECGGDSFSGNFMNWAASSAIDMLRLAVTGGDRVIDTATTTVLQRAVLMDTANFNYYAHDAYFPRRVVQGGGNVSVPYQVTPFNTPTLYVVSCRNRILFSDTNSGMKGNESPGTAGSYCSSSYSGGAPVPNEAKDKKLGEYLARVRVCDAAEAATRSDLCKKYGNNYKPVGEIQSKSDRARVAAMGYLLDDSSSRYGGVLRAPMKYVGSTKIDPRTFVEIPNDRPEWDNDTGAFYTNPEDPANRDSVTANSGVINYLNKFGRSGRYKELDPVSELYYEGIRYLQGKQPTAAATSGMTDAMKDGFPVIESWTDPIVASCQKNYMISIGDVNTHWDRYIPGNDRTNNDSARSVETAPDLDVKVWTKKVGDMESNANGERANPSPRANLAGLENIDTGAAGHGTYYMAGLAYWANTHDIRTDKPVRVKTFAIDVDEGGNGLVDGSSRAIQPRNSQLYLAAKYGGFDDINGDANPFVTRDVDGNTVSGTNAEWDNGFGVPRNYFLAGQPRQTLAAIRKIFNKIGDVSGTISGVSASSTQLTANGAFVYQPGFNTSKWSGSLKKFALMLRNDGGIDIATRETWDAGQILTGTELVAADPTPDVRKIYTTKVNPNSATTVEFKWDSLSDAQKSALNVSPDDGSADDLGAPRVEFLRGTRSLEAGQPNGIFRARDRILGDIVNGNPVFVDAPSSNVQGAGYQDFYNRNRSRAPAVYMGANDGMMHAFNANDGKELFAYVPNAVIPALNQLTSPNYVHRSYVDGPATAKEALVNGRWKTVLASGMGAGGQGVFALDVTDPANFAGGAGALWEFTDADDADMGNIISAPVLAKFKTGTVNGLPVYRYFAVVSSGLNNYRDDGQGRFNQDAASALFLLSLDKSPSDPWRQGVNYFKLRLPSSSADLENGLGAPALVTDSNGTVRYAYVGDLQGNLWRIDFSSAASLSVVAVRDPLFVAKDAQGRRQPITMQPKVVFAPGGGYVIVFGSGKFVERADAAVGNFTPQSFYAIYDSKGPITTIDRSQLAARTVSASGDGLQISGSDFVYGSLGAGKGWYVDFLDSATTGERAVTNPVLSNGMLFFNSLIPGASPCTGGGGRTYILNVLTGLVPNGVRTGQLSAVGMMSSPVVFQTGADVADRDAIGRRTVSKKTSVANFGTNGATGGGAVHYEMPSGRFSWREILNWQEVRNALAN